MSVKSSSDHYGKVAITLHWLSVLLILVLLGSGFRAGDMENAAAKAATLRVHVPLGILVLLLTLTRIAWWWFVDKKPQAVAMPIWQDRAARAVHVLFYVIILGMAASGIGMMVLSGAGSILFGDGATTLPDFWDYTPRIPHGIGARVFSALLVLHVGAALYHQFIKKDGLLRRIWY